MRKDLLEDARLLRDALRLAVPVEEEGKVLARRQQLMSVLEQEIVATPQRIKKFRARSYVHRGLLVVSAAAVLVGTLWIGMLISQSDSLQTPVTASRATESPAGVASSVSAPAGDHPALDLPTLAGKSFQTEVGHEKRVQMVGNTELVLASSTQLSIWEDTETRQELYVTRGEVSLSVPESRSPRSVQVRTAHATVSVTGTVFSVFVGEFDQPVGTPPRTRVTVTRGQVRVQYTGGEITLNEGDSWVSPLENSTHSRAVPSETKLRTQAPDRETISTLAAQNRLLEQALSAEERGDPERAKALIHEFLARYPSSPLRGAALTLKKRLP